MLILYSQSKIEDVLVYISDTERRMTPVAAPNDKRAPCFFFFFLRVLLAHP